MFASALLGHLVGDFILQNDYFARRKKEDSIACALHCLTWTLSVCLFGQITHLGAAAWLFLTHFAIDRTCFVAWFMQWNNQEVFQEKLAPWSSIMVDNIFHLLTIWVVYNFLVPGHHTLASTVASSMLIFYGLFVLEVIRIKRNGRISSQATKKKDQVQEDSVQDPAERLEDSTVHPATGDGFTETDPK